MIFSVKMTYKQSWVPHPFRVLCGMGGNLNFFSFGSIALLLIAGTGLTSGCESKNEGSTAPPAPTVIHVAGKTNQAKRGHVLLDRVGRSVALERQVAQKNQPRTLPSRAPAPERGP